VLDFDGSNFFEFCHKPDEEDVVVQRCQEEELREAHCRVYLGTTSTTEVNHGGNKHDHRVDYDEYVPKRRDKQDKKCLPLLVGEIGSLLPYTPDGMPENTRLKDC